MNILQCGRQALDLSRPLVMGVLNVTPDSFSDGGRFMDPDAAVVHGMRLAEEGAQIIDIGGESTRPGADPVDVDEEIRRVVPVIEKLRTRIDAVISIDTSKPEVMRAAATAGAALINDIRALSESNAVQTALDTGCAVCLMHMQGEPRNMQLAPHYVDVVSEVKTFLAARVKVCRAAGIPTDRIVIDPGFGFGKTVEHNLQLLRRLAELGTGFPILAGLSRKSTVGTLTGRPQGDRVHGSVALAVIAALNGARILRVHDVAATVDAMKIVTAFRGL